VARLVGHVTIGVDTIRQAFVSLITTSMGGAGWREGTGVWDTFGDGEGDNRLHKGYAVGCPSTAARPGRQRRALGALAETTVSVRWAYNLAAKDQTGSYDTALDAERQIIAAITLPPSTNSLRPILVSSSRDVDDQGWMVGEITWLVVHMLPIS
jgi:hypothetical protein